MISGVTKTLEGGSHTFRFGARAMTALEDQFDQGIVEIVQNFQENAEAGKLRIGTLIRIIAECANDGDGVEDAEANQIFDQIGAMGAAELLGQCMEKAFPEASTGRGDRKTSKNGKRASRSK